MANPFAFRPPQVTFWIIMYFLLLASIVYLHESVPAAPSLSPMQGLNLTQAWADLTVLTNDLHPFNSRENDVVRAWLLARLEGIQQENHAGESMFIFDDNVSNVTMVNLSHEGLGHMPSKSQKAGTYYEGNNIIVYIPGRDDPEILRYGRGYQSFEKNSTAKDGVLVGAHFDTAPMSPGAADNGAGLVSILQIVTYFTLPTNQPRHGIVALLNNNKEGGLWGARAFQQHPLGSFCRTFLNLNSAGVGGRTALLRATDLGVVDAYRKVPSPFGTVLSSNLYKLSFVESDTDYSVYTNESGMRGLEMGFYHQQSKHHTKEDDVQHISLDSIWHMLSTGLEVVKSLSEDSKPEDESTSASVWLDLFSQVFVAFNLDMLFPVSFYILSFTPLVLFLIMWTLYQADKLYFFSSKKKICEEAALEPVLLGGTRGIMRFQIAFLCASAVVCGSGVLLSTYNPFVIYANGYAVCAMMVSLFYLVFWALAVAADRIRPSALHRGYAMLSLFGYSWPPSFITTMVSRRLHLAFGYPFVLFQTILFIASIISLLELFALPTKTKFAQSIHDDHELRDFQNAVGSRERSVIQTGDETSDPNEYEQSPANETSPLVGENNNGQSKPPSTTFGAVYRKSVASIQQIKPQTATTKDAHKPYGDEQLWSAKLPSSLWLIQFSLIGPFFASLIAPHTLAIFDWITQRSADGDEVLAAYMFAACLSIVLVLPLTPFLHRGRHLLPIIMLVICTITITFNLVTFPFSESSKYKIRFSQEVNLDSGTSTLHLAGAEDFIRPVLARVPSAMGHEVVCSKDFGFNVCSFDGSHVMPDIGKAEGDDWLSCSSSRDDDIVRITVDGKDTRKCGVYFPNPISSFQVDRGNGLVEGQEMDSITLYRRQWYTPWNVQVNTSTKEEIGVKVWCDWGEMHRLPFLEEAVHYLPEWVTLTSFSNELLRVSRTYRI